MQLEVDLAEGYAVKVGTPAESADLILGEEYRACVRVTGGYPALLDLARAIIEGCPQQALDKPDIEDVEGIVRALIGLLGDEGVVDILNAEIEERRSFEAGVAASRAGGSDGAA